MLRGIVECNGLIVVYSTFRDISRQQQGIGHEAKADHEWHRRLLRLRERKEMRRALTESVAIEGDLIRDREAVEHREQQQRIVGRLSQRFSLPDQQTCLLRSRFGFSGGIAFDM